MVTKNRPVNQMGFSHGGVAIAFRESACTFKEIQIQVQGNFEVVAASERFPGYSRQLVVVGCYLPPTYSLTTGAVALDHIKQVVVQIKLKFRSPFICCLLYTSPSPRDS